MQLPSEPGENGLLGPNVTQSVQKQKELEEEPESVMVEIVLEQTSKIRNVPSNVLVTFWLLKENFYLYKRDLFKSSSFEIADFSLCFSRIKVHWKMSEEEM